MVKFSSIVVSVEDRIEIYSSFATFQSARFNLWERQNNLHQFAGNALEYMRQRVTEEVLEEHYGYENKVLEGACLVFGTDIAAKRCLTNSAIRDTLTDPLSDVQVSIKATKVEVRFSTPNSSIFIVNYPAHLTLLPRFQ